MIELARLPSLLRARGVQVVETAGWLSRGYDTLTPVGQLNHHTAVRGPCTPSTAEAMIRGRSDLPGPLCNGHGGLGANGKFVVYMIAARRARHAGPGSAAVLSEVQRGIAPSGDARTRGLTDDSASGNRSLFGWEWQHPGDDSPYADALLEGVGECNAALAELAGWAAARSIHHREWTPRKIDMSWRGDLRALVARHMEEDDMTPEQAKQLADVAAAVARLDTRSIEHGREIDVLKDRTKRIIDGDATTPGLRDLMDAIKAGGGTAATPDGEYEVTLRRKT